MNNSSIGSVAIGLSVVVAAAIAPVVAFFAPKGMTLVVVAAAASGLIVSMRRKRSLPKFDRSIAAVFLVTVLWAMLSAAWSVDHWLSFSSAVSMAANLLVGTVLFMVAAGVNSDERRLVEIALSGGFGVALGMIVLEVLFEGPIISAVGGREYQTVGSGAFWLNQCAMLIALLVWPVGVILCRRYRAGPAIALLAASLTMIYLASYLSGVVALIAGSLAAGIVYCHRRAGGMVLATALALYVMAAPMVVATVVEPETIARTFGKPSKSVMHRLHIWKFAAARIGERPIRGWGMRTARAIPGGQDTPTDNVYGTYADNLPLHPHSATLQIWLELGMPGAILLSILVGYLALRLTASTVPRETAAAGAGLLATAFGVVNLSYGIWQSWLLASLWLGASMMLVVSNVPPQPSRRPP